RIANCSLGPDVDDRGEVLRITYSSGRAPVYPTAAMAAAAVLTIEQVRAWRENRTPGTHQRVFVINSSTGSVTLERLIPDSSCRACGEAARSTVPRMTESDFSRGLQFPRFRLNDTTSLADSLEQAYLQPHVGIVKQVAYDLQSPF